MRLNPDKCHLVVSGHKHECILANIGSTSVIESYQEKLLGISIDRDLTFENHVMTSCKNALSRQCKIPPFYKRKTLINTFFDSLFAYCPLVWMFHNRQLNTKINNLHYRALRIIYRDESSTFDELLKKDVSITIHHRNICAIAIEMYKVQNGLAHTFMREIFPLRNLRNVECVASNIRNQVDFYNTANPKSTNCGLETLERHLGPIVWNAIPTIIRDSPSNYI